MANIEELIDQAYAQFNNKKFEQSLAKLEEAEIVLQDLTVLNSKFRQEELNDFTASIENFKGFNFLSLNQVDKAKESFEKSLNLNPNSSQACAGLGEVYYLCHQEEEAKIMYEWAVDSNPINQFAVKGLEKVNRALGLPPNHNTLNIETVLRKKDNFSKLLSEAYKHFNAEQFTKALETIEEIEDLFPKSLNSKENNSKIASIENFKGFNYLGLENLDEAKLCFEKALNLNPTSSQACAGLGRVLSLLEKHQEAKTMFEWAIKHNPTNLFAIKELAKVNKLLGFTESHSTI